MTYPGCCAKCGFSLTEHREGGDAAFCGEFDGPDSMHWTPPDTQKHQHATPETTTTTKVLT